MDSLDLQMLMDISRRHAPELPDEDHESLALEGLRNYLCGVDAMRRHRKPPERAQVCTAGAGAGTEYWLP